MDALAFKEKKITKTTKKFDFKIKYLGCYLTL